MNRRQLILLVSISTLMIACGGNKRVIATRKTPPPSQRKKEVRREEKKIITETPSKPKVVAPYAERVQKYIYEYSSIAKLEMAKYGIPASITLAQGILESGAGAGELTTKANNHFGIKCHDWVGEKVYHDDDRLQECFRKYDKASQSFRDHSLFLKNRKRYADLFTHHPSDYKSWAIGLRAAGYATDKKYPVKLINIIERYQLYTYDKQVLGSKYKGSEQVVTQKPVATVTPEKPKVVNANQHVVQKGDTLYSISRRYNIKVAQLKAYNDLKDNIIAIGQVLKVQPD